jgi:hypothetical protein
LEKKMIETTNQLYSIGVWAQHIMALVEGN